MKEKNLVINVTLSPEDVKHFNVMHQYYIDERGFDYSNSGVIKAALADCYVRVQKEKGEI